MIPTLALLAAAAIVAAPDLRGLVPDAAAVPSWRASDAPAQYDAGTLSNFIDGGAEVFVQYGVHAAINQEYSRGDETIACTVYEMSDPQAAFGVFSYFRTPHKIPAQIGDGGFRADLQLTFWQDRYFVIVETFSTNDSTRDTLATFARAISDRIGTHAPAPAILRRLPPGFTAGSEKLFSHDLATGALRAALSAGELVAGSDTVLLTADFTRNGAEARLLLMPFATGAALDAAWRSIGATLAADAACQPSSRAEISCAHDGRLLVVRRTSDAIAIVSDAPTREVAKALLDLVGS